MSASHASCSLWVQGLDPPSHSPLIVRQSGTGICCPWGANFESCAGTIAQRASVRKMQGRKVDLMRTLLDGSDTCRRNIKGFKVRVHSWGIVSLIARSCSGTALPDG